MLSRLSFMLGQRGTLQRAARAADSAGGSLRTWAAVSGAANVRCQAAPAGGDVQERYQQRQIVVTHQIFCEKDLGAVSGDRFIIGSARYEVRGIEPFEHQNLARERVYQLDCQRVY